MDSLCECDDLNLTAAAVGYRCIGDDVTIVVNRFNDSILDSSVVVGMTEMDTHAQTKCRASSRENKSFSFVEKC